MSWGGVPPAAQGTSPISEHLSPKKREKREGKIRRRGRRSSDREEELAGREEQSKRGPKLSHEQSVVSGTAPCLVKIKQRLRTLEIRFDLPALSVHLEQFLGRCTANGSQQKHPVRIKQRSFLYPRLILTRFLTYFFSAAALASSGNCFPMRRT